MKAVPESLESLVARADRLYHDVGLESVAAWKAKRPGAKAFGFMPVWAPRELIHAAGVLPVGIMGGGDDVEIIKGDACYQSYICHIPRSTIEMGLNGSLEALDGMVFPSICDVIRNLSGMWKMMFPGKASFYLDLPQSFDDIGIDFFAAELGRLGEVLEEMTGKAVDPKELRRSIALYNENKSLIRELYDARAETPWFFPTAEVYVVLRAGNVMPVDEHNRFLADYMAAARASGRRLMDNARVVVAGSFCEQPPLGLIKTIERSGCYIVDDDFVLGSRLIEGDVALDGDPIRALSEAFVKKSREASFLYREKDKGAELAERVKRRQAEGVLFCAPSFCDPALLDQPLLTGAVDSAAIPHTSFKYAENTGQFHVIKEQAGAFADSIKLWSHQ